MLNNIKIFLTVLGLFVYQAQLSAQSPNFTGTWVLNLKKSQLESRPPGLTGSVFIIKQDGDKFKLTRYHLYGKKRRRLSLRMIADGKTRRMKLLLKGKLERKDGDLQSTIWGMNIIKNAVNYRFGNNQNEFIADEVFTGKPKNHHNIWIFDRESSK
ncbi:MAG TPA: hypothetical protein VGB63_00595 [Pedobacter sp.]|jgi:hypothetical protein